jgi:hypothetical protein
VYVRFVFQALKLEVAVVNTRLRLWAQAVVPLSANY